MNKTAQKMAYKGVTVTELPVDTTNSKATEYKSFPSFLIKVDSDKGIVEHIVSVIGNVDLGGDRILPGAFTKTITERGPKVRVLDQHNTQSIRNVVGRPLSMREIARDELPSELIALFPMASGGLLVQTQFAMETQAGRDTFELIRGGFVDEYSIGYDALDVDFEEIEVDGETINVRNLRSIRLWEYSPVIWGMNPATVTVGVKEAKPVPAMQNFPLAGRDREWASADAIKRVQAWAGGPESDTMEWGKYRRAFFWFNNANITTLGAYKLPYVDIVNGSPQAIPRAIFAIAAALQGGRGGVNIAVEDKDKIKAQIGRWYARMRDKFDDESIIPPWDKAAPDGEGDKGNYSDGVGVYIWSAFAKRWVFLEFTDDYISDEKARADAPNLRPAEGNTACGNCKFFKQLDGDPTQGACLLYDFVPASTLLCDSWQARSEGEVASAHEDEDDEDNDNDDEDKVTDTIEDKETSLMDRIRVVVDAFDDVRGNHDFYAVHEVFETSLIVFAFPDAPRRDHTFYQLAYTRNGDAITFEDFDAWRGGNYSFVLGAKSLQKFDSSAKSAVKSKLIDGDAPDITATSKPQAGSSNDSPTSIDPMRKIELQRQSIKILEVQSDSSRDAGEGQAA